MTLRDPLAQPNEPRRAGAPPEGFEECERCGALISRRTVLKHLNWHEALAGALRGKPPRK